MSFRHQKDWKTLYFKSTSERNQCTQTQEHEPILYFKLSAALRLNDRDSTCLALPWEPPLLDLTNTSWPFTGMLPSSWEQRKLSLATVHIPPASVPRCLSQPLSSYRSCLPRRSGPDLTLVSHRILCTETAQLRSL